MKKRILSFIMSAVTVLSVITMLTVSVSAVAFSKTYGYNSWFSKSIPKLGSNTQIITLTKSFPNTTYSEVKLNSNSTVHDMNIWVMTPERRWMSDKVTAYPDNNMYRIKYYSNMTFPTGGQVVLWGEQDNVLSDKKAEGTFFCY